MKEHLVVHLKDELVTLICLDNDNTITKAQETSLAHLNSDIKKLSKSLKKNIDRLIIVPETSSTKTTFLNISIGPTDSFNDCLLNKLSSLNLINNNSLIKYKIISEINEDKINYLLSVMVIPVPFYQNISKHFKQIAPERSIHWIPADYCLLLSFLNEPSIKMDSLIIHITEDQTNIIIKNNTQKILVTSFPFSINKIKKSLSQDGLSENQIQNKLSLGFSFKENIGFNTKKLLNDFLSDIQKDIFFILTKVNIKIVSSIIIAEGCTKSDLDKIISEALLMPCSFGAIPDKATTSLPINMIQEKRLVLITTQALEIVKNMQFFISYLPVLEKTKPNKLIIKLSNSTIWFFVSLLFLLLLILIINIKLTFSLNSAKTSFYGLKEHLTMTKTQYITISESLYQYDNLEKMQSRLKTLEKERKTLKSSLENIYKQIPKEILTKSLTITLRDKKLLVTGLSEKEESVFNYVKNLSLVIPEQTILLKRIHPSTPIKFTIEVHL